MTLSLSAFGLTEGINEEFPSLDIRWSGIDRGCDYIIWVGDSEGVFLCNLQVSWAGGWVSSVLAEFGSMRVLAASSELSCLSALVQKIKNTEIKKAFDIDDYMELLSRYIDHEEGVKVGLCRTLGDSNFSVRISFDNGDACIDLHGFICGKGKWRILAKDLWGSLSAGQIARLQIIVGHAQDMIEEVSGE